MATDARADQTTPRLSSLRLPADASPLGMLGNAHVLWRLTTRRKRMATMESGNPSEEFRNVCEFMRLFATLRFYQLALLLGTTGSIVTALTSNAVQHNFARIELLKSGGLVVCAALMVMEFRASSYWHRLRSRGNELARVLRFEAFPTSSRWNPLSTSGASFYLHLFIASLWLSSLVVGPQVGR